MFKLLGKAFKENDGAHRRNTRINRFTCVITLDGFSRFLLHWELMTDMSGLSVKLFTQRTIDKYPEARPAIETGRRPGAAVHSAP